MSKKTKKKEKPKKDVLKSEKYVKYSKAKYPALNVNRQVANRKEYLEVDYLHKLNDEEKEFLNSFQSETVITNFKHRGEKLYDKDNRKEFYDDNNRRNRCMLSKAKATGMIVSYSKDSKGIQYFNHLIEQSKVYLEDKEGVEDALLTLIDLKNGKFDPESED